MAKTAKNATVSVAAELDGVKQREGSSTTEWSNITTKVLEIQDITGADGRKWELIEFEDAVTLTGTGTDGKTVIVNGDSAINVAKVRVRKGDTITVGLTVSKKKKEATLSFKP